MLPAVGCSNRDTFVNEWSLDIDKAIVLMFEELGNSKYDMDALIKNRGLEEDISFLFVEAVSNQKNLEKLAEEGKFVYTTDFDFDNYRLLIAYGREILELECVSSKYIRQQYGSHWYSMSVTFGEDYFFNTVFFYRITKDYSIVRTDYGIFTYVMNDTEKVQVNVGLINRYKRFGSEGIG
jgi:hypothetical protein